MKKTVKKWRSPSLGRDMKLAIYGEAGTPVLALPTRGKTCRQWEEHGMTDAIALQLEEGFNQLFCVDSIDEEGFLNKNVEPSKRLIRHIQYESFIIEEVVPLINQHNQIAYIIIVGVDLGGYHAINSSLKHPNEFGKAIGISGIYDIKQFLDGYYSDNVYYNNPVDYLPNLNKQPLLNSIRNVDYRLVSFSNDVRKEQAERMARMFQIKFIDHKLDIWDIDEDDEWSLWRQMLKTHII